ncbi:MAG: prenyltransferase [Azoarcus sp.]|jgi:1,4-dihydroxy-2-naphthoate octaprenyltransferase|nr:prenyltransferase [Azoarcus sp.]
MSLEPAISSRIHPAEPLPGHFRRPFSCYFAATRPAFLSVTLVGCLIGLASACASGVTFDPLRGLIVVLFALVAHAGTNVVNDYHDARSGADAANHERIFPFTGGSRFIQNGVLSERSTGIFGHVLLALVIPPGLWLAWTSGPGLLLIGAAGLFFGWAYTAPPLALVRRGLGEIAIAAGWLLVVTGSDYALRGNFSFQPVAAGLSFALLVVNVLYINQFPDRAGDNAAGKRTLVVRLGADTAKWGYLLIGIVAHAWLIAMVGKDILPQKTGLAAFTVVLTLTAGRDLLEHAGEPAALRSALIRTILAANLHGALIAITLAWAAGQG